MIKTSFKVLELMAGATSTVSAVWNDPPRRTADTSPAKIPAGKILLAAEVYTLSPGFTWDNSGTYFNNTAPVPPAANSTYSRPGLNNEAAE